jgi:hypothetical protein
MATGDLQLAINMKAFHINPDFFLINNLVMLAKTAFSENLTWQKKNEFPPIHELLKTLTTDFGAHFHVRASCFKPYGLEVVNLIKNAAIKPGAYLVELLLDRENIRF